MFFLKKDIEGEIRQRNEVDIIGYYCSLKDTTGKTKGKVKEGTPVVVYIVHCSRKTFLAFVFYSLSVIYYLCLSSLLCL